MNIVLVKSFDEVVENIRQFNVELEKNKNIIKLLSMFRHWYYIPELNLFGPSKYIGYEKMDAEKYLSEYNPVFDGRDTEPVLKKWFDKISGNDAQWLNLSIKLTGLIQKYKQKGKKEPNKRLSFHIPNQDFLN